MVSPAARLGKIPPYLFGEIARAKAKAKAEGRDLIDFGIGDPDQPTPPAIIDALSRAAHDPETHRYDESDAGWPPFLESVSRWYGRRFGVELDPASEILLLIGSKEGLAHLAWAYIDPGDLSLAPDPAYTVYKMNTLLAGGDVHAMPLRAENGFLPRLNEIPPAVADRAKLLYLNYPNNPTGATASLEFFTEVVAFARRHNLIVCHDCAYSEVYFDGHRPPATAPPLPTPPRQIEGGRRHPTAGPGRPSPPTGHRPDPEAAAPRHGRLSASLPPTAPAAPACRSEPAGRPAPEAQGDRESCDAEPRPSGGPERAAGKHPAARPAIERSDSPVADSQSSPFASSTSDCRQPPARAASPGPTPAGSSASVVVDRHPFAPKHRSSPAGAPRSPAADRYLSPGRSCSGW
jgi:hypothetical protein